MPQVSIVIPTHDRATFLKESLFSCLHQTFTDFEVIVVDDHSEEDIQAIMKSEDPVGLAIETQLEKDYDEIYPQSPGDDVSENDMIDHGYWPPRDR